MPQPKRTIVISGGIVSGIGKGITAASLGRLLLNRGYTVVPVKADPYLNQDAGTMNPFQHGEVFVTDDGAETDLDLGHYERFLDQNLTKFSSFTSGSVYRSVMEMERDGDFLGNTIQIIPHVTDEIKRRLRMAVQPDDLDFLLCEIGGTVGDIEALPFIEAIRQFSQEGGQTVFVHVVKMDYLYPSDEAKTKPIQHAVTTLRSYGLQPDVLVVRCKRPLLEGERQKISTFTGVPMARIVAAPDADSLDTIPDILEENGLCTAVLHAFGVESVPLKERVVKKLSKAPTSLKVGLVGKYTDHGDAYLSVLEAVRHAARFYEADAEIVPILSDGAEVESLVRGMDAIIVPGGFGSRGIEGKIAAIQVVREEKIPFLGICLGLQTAVIESARHIAKLKKANSTEFEEECPEPVVAILPDQLGIKRKGGTMRLGSYPAILTPKSLAHRLYSTYRAEEVVNNTILERHRHRFEVNPAYHASLEKTGLVFSGMSPDGSLVEFMELPLGVHPYFIATQAHPEFRSRIGRPHPLFAGLIAAALTKKKAGS